MANRSDRDPPSLNELRGQKPTWGNEARIGRFHQGQRAESPAPKAGYKTAICLPVILKSVLAFREASIQEAMGLGDVDLSAGLRFALYSGVIQSAVDGMGVAMGHTAMIDGELESGRLVAFDALGFSSPKAYHLVMSGSAAGTRQARELAKWLEFECRDK